ncbi:MAG: 4Fe-4S binding protein [Armatimonadetes bacterium]|nr:4Fe-4S binding protein [Armatimonadota bacterium]
MTLLAEGAMAESQQFKTRKPDLDYYSHNVACRVACPLGTDARGYVVAISEGRYLDAYRIARARNPLASVCGRACSAPCEDACNRRNIDAPVSIRDLKTFVCQQLGPEALVDSHYGLELSTASGSAHPEPNGMSVAVVGAGPAGLTLSHDLARLGYRCVVFEEKNRAGGQLCAMPESVLPAAVLQAEVDAIGLLGVELRLAQKIGREALGELESQFDAAVLASGHPGPHVDAPSTFVAGNAAIGPEPFIYAMANAQQVARQVHEHLTAQTLEERTCRALTPIPLPAYRMPVNWDVYPRQKPERMTEPVEVMLSYPEVVAQQQGARCLRCDINTVFDADACTMCGLCVEICPEQVIAMVPGAQVRAGAGHVAVLLKDDSKCTRCGLCARICLEDAISMQALEHVEEITCHTRVK